MANTGLTMRQRWYRGTDDLLELQRLVAERTARMDRGWSLHPGDVAHRIYNVFRFEDPSSLVPIWEDAEGLAGFGLLWPKEQNFELVTRPELGAAEHRSLLDQTIEMVSDGNRVETDVSGNDTALIELLTDAGFRWVEDAYGFTGRHLDDSIVVPQSEFRVRSVTLNDAAGLAEIHAASFGSTWTPELYANLMTTPGYSPDREIVAVAENGSFAGFTVMWHDYRNLIGHFEPVGVHSDYRRRGVGSLLLQEGMVRMKVAGMTYATVLHDIDDFRSAAFYAANGFVKLSAVTRWERHQTQS